MHQALHTCLHAFDLAFPGHLHSAYVVGSYADQTHVATSDLDLTIIFSGDWLQRHRADAEHLAEECARRCSVELDVELMDEAETRRGVAPQLKSGSTLIWGTDLRDAMLRMPIEEWTRSRMHSSLWRSATLFGRPGAVMLPLTYPDPTAEFYGYDARTVHLPDGTEAPCTRDLIRLVGWAATALLALRAGVYVARKRDCHQLYREHIGDGWTPLIEEIYARCRGEWGYLIPAAPTDRAAFRAICERTLAFENHFLGIYRVYLLHELDDPTAAHLPKLLGLLKHVSLQDDAIEAALRNLRRRGAMEIRVAAERALARMQG